MAKDLTLAQERIAQLQDQGLSAEDIALTVHLSVTSVKSQLKRIRKKASAGSYNPPEPPLFAKQER